MAANTDHPMSLRAVRQLRRVRAFYAAGVLLWAASTAWMGWEHPASRQMWVSALLLAVFTGLLITASLWIRRLEATGADRPVHHAASHKTTGPRHAHA
ncbi:hypothetical protein ACFYRY_42535 [Streptomyces sp. NPDC005263]|uniref:hypothetical protein n=1 Tax=Streptomyces sp. NPDC005263 TaxID=3364711 RepID=UPI0036A5F833